MVGLGHPIGHRITDTDARAHPPARACMYVCAGGVALASSSSVTPLAGTSVERRHRVSFDFAIGRPGRGVSVCAFPYC